ncbi:hypothetical protein F4824DRAFT_504728 [Ustulina deusta]|nr:hypothetical protein F4824DRAFT_504728 [Ustulina deusta]
MFSPTSISSASSEESYTTRMLANVRRAQEDFDRMYEYRSSQRDRGSVNDPSGADSPPWVTNPYRDLERPKRTWLSPLKDLWDSILMCFGFKSVSGPD